jgi:hypothetical protein
LQSSRGEKALAIAITVPCLRQTVIFAFSFGGTSVVRAAMRIRNSKASLVIGAVIYATYASLLQWFLREQASYAGNASL